ncbi:MAG: imidazole glycerol phosphate synthase subunit HisH [bacterium]
MSLKITIIDYEAGNLRNIQKAIEHLGYKALISKQINAVEEADILVLPGVGAFHSGMNVLEGLGLIEALRKAVIKNRKPLLGVCLGMQLLGREGHEGGKRAGLGFLPMTIHRLQSDKKGLRLPHIGWDNVVASDHSVLFSEIPKDPDFYFVHSYQAVCEDESIIAATCEYGHRFVAAVEKDNIFATQFHPEKSQRYGLQVLKNFMNYCKTYKPGND